MHFLPKNLSSGLVPLIKFTGNRWRPPRLQGVHGYISMAGRDTALYQYLLFNGPVTNDTELLFLKRPEPISSEPNVQGRAKRHFKPPPLHTTEKDCDVDCHSAFTGVGSSFLGYGRVGRQPRRHQMQSRQVILRKWACPSFRLHTQGKLT